MTKVLTILLMILFSTLASNAQNGVTINQDGATAAASAILDVSSTAKGLLIPRMSQSQITAIEHPADGLMAFNTTDDKLYIYFSSDNKWKAVAYVWDVVTTATGKTWLDRNLGATEVATSKTDANAYGDLYQWGRAADGHEKRNSPVYSSGLATTSTPNQGNAWDGKFITSGSSPYDWLQTQDGSLWQGVDGVNNPCPPGFRLPTETEWDNESQSWSTDDDAFGSPLKLSDAGRRLTPDASLNQVGTDGIYWSSTVNGANGRALHIKSTTVNVGNRRRALGATVRCIKD